MKIHSVKFNFIMNFIMSASSIVFPLITFPYISRVLMATGNGKVATASAVIHTSICLHLWEFQPMESGHAQK